MMGNLTVKQIQQVCHKILENARELVEEAEILLNHRHYPRAYYLAYLSIEELSKIPMLTRAATEVALGQGPNWNRLKKKLNTHKEKLHGGLFFGCLLGLVLGDIKEPEIAHEPDLNAIKGLEQQTKELVANKRGKYVCGFDLWRVSEAV